MSLLRVFLMILIILLLCFSVSGSVHHWNSATDGLWSVSSNWDSDHVPSPSSSVVLTPQSLPITITVSSNVVISSLTLASNFALLFESDSTLTISDALVLTGGTLHTAPSSTSSFTTVDSLVLQVGHTVLIAHKLIVSGLYDCIGGIIDLDDLSELKFVDVTDVVLESRESRGDIIPNLFLHYSWSSSFNTVDFSGRHDSTAIEIIGPQWKSDDSGGYLDVKPGNVLHIPNLLGQFGWRDRTISLWMNFERGGMGFGAYQQPCRFWFDHIEIGWGSGTTKISPPLQSWFNLVITTTQSHASVYINGIHRWTHSASSAYSCTSGPVSYFPLTNIDNYDDPFIGKIRAVQIFERILTLTEIRQLDYNPPFGIRGKGKLSLINSKAILSSDNYIYDLGSIHLSSSILQTSDVTLNNLKNLEIGAYSLFSLTDGSKILSNDLSLTLSSSELYYDDSVEISTSILRLKAVNSKFQNDFNFSDFLVLDLSYSCFESLSDLEVSVGHFVCIHCQLLGNSALAIDSFLKSILEIFLPLLLFKNLSLLLQFLEKFTYPILLISSVT
ncbi:hypothetical protein GEMRC1_008872 [Eukaryota sp. GEM-RC1]